MTSCHARMISSAIIVAAGAVLISASMSHAELFGVGLVFMAIGGLTCAAEWVLSLWSK